MADTCCFYTTLTTTPKLATPEGLTSSAVTATGATLTWTAVEDATTYIVNYTPGGTAKEVTGTTTSLTGLTAETEYTATVVAMADGYTNSDPATEQFTTAAA